MFCVAFSAFGHPMQVFWFVQQEKTNNEHESRTLKELREMKECTFKPSVNPTRLKETTLTAPAAIKGLERHLELQSSAKQMKRNQEELERKLFFSHVCEPCISWMSISSFNILARSLVHIPIIHSDCNHFKQAYTSSTRQYTIPRPFLLQTGQGRYSGRKTWRLTSKDKSTRADYHNYWVIMFQINHIWRVLFIPCLFKVYKSSYFKPMPFSSLHLCVWLL